jgi:hypothetical protein
MPKRRFDEARVLAAVAANDPPASADHLDVDEWHAAQDKWLVKWSGSVLFDGLLQYGCSVLGSAPMVAAERQCRARQAGTAAEQHARRAADSLASKGRRKVLRAQPQHCRADAEAAVESTDQAHKVWLEGGQRSAAASFGRQTRERCDLDTGIYIDGPECLRGGAAGR